MKTLAIETSCDDTSIAIVSYESVFNVEKILAYSQVKDHQQYGGVVPEIASRLHSEQIIQVLNGIGFDEIAKVDFISVTTHPGLPGSLLVGKTVANMLGEYFDKPIVNVNHIWGHLFSILVDRKIQDIKFPIAVLTASGGHNDIYIVKQLDQKLDIDNQDIISTHHLAKWDIYRVGLTIDDASGEAFDKVSRMLGGEYPGGPWISKKAQEYLDNYSNFDFSKYADRLGTGKFFKRIVVDKDSFNFSFSGAKSQVYNFLQKLKKQNIDISDAILSVIAYEFQESVVNVMVDKLLAVQSKYNLPAIAIAGGVSANRRRRELLLEKAENTKIYKPAKFLYSTDNAAMIGTVGLLEKLIAL